MSIVDNQEKYGVKRAMEKYQASNSRGDANMEHRKKKIVGAIIILILLLIVGILGYGWYWYKTAQQKCTQLVTALEESRIDDANAVLDAMTKGEVTIRIEEIEQAFTNTIAVRYTALGSFDLQNATKGEATKYLQFGQLLEEKAKADLQAQNDALQELISLCEKYNSQQAELRLVGCEEETTFTNKMSLAIDMVNFSVQMGDASYGYSSVTELTDYVSEVNLTEKYGKNSTTLARETQMRDLANAVVDMYNAVVDLDISKYQEAANRVSKELEKSMENGLEGIELAESALQDATNITEKFRLLREM